MDIGSLEDFPVGQARDGMVGDDAVIIYHFPQGEVHVWKAICPHLGSPLEAGDCEGAVCICPLHAWEFNLRSGQEMFGMDGLDEFPCEVVDGRVVVTPG